MLVSLALAGCFGSGPVPALAPDAPIVFAAPVPSAAQTCTGSTYITSIAFGSELGYAVLYPYGPQNSSNCTQQVSAPSPVMSFPLDGSAPAGMTVGSAGMSNTQVPPPQLVLGSAGPVWVFDQPAQPAQANVVELGGAPIAITANGSNQGQGYLVGLAGNTLATANALQASDPMDPNYPCCVDTGGADENSPGLLVNFQIAGTQATTTTQQLSAIAIGELASSIVANDDALYYIEPKPPSFGIEAVSGSASTELAQIDDEQPIPVGLAADASHIAWAFAQNAEQTPLQLGCSVWVTDAPGSAGATIDKVFTSTSLSCMGLALDPNAVYFALVEEVQPTDCGGCSPYLHGVGVGRVDFATHSFTSIAFDVAAPASGPRRVFTANSDPADLFVADPLAIAKIAKTAFDGRMDLSP